MADAVRRKTLFVSGFGRLTFYFSPFTHDEDVTEGVIDGATTVRRVFFHGDRP
jgi:hypothetical protein